MCEDRFSVRTVVSKEVCGTYGCSPAAPPRGTKCRCVCTPHGNGLAASRCELAELEKLDSQGALTGPILRTRTHLSGFLGNAAPARGGTTRGDREPTA